MTRYFMTIPEASRLILQASMFGDPGDLFVLDMGDPVRIVDLARDLARLAGRDPDSVPIRYIGLRPGEKLHESLFYESEAFESTAHLKVLRVRSRAGADLDPDTILGVLDELVAVGASGDHESSRVALRAALERLDPTPARARA
jgi:FlaA1/EpsC-like NDP-sugar epimerase